MITIRPNQKTRPEDPSFLCAIEVNGRKYELSGDTEVLALQEALKMRQQLSPTNRTG